jgi:hypothetical protein
MNDGLSSCDRYSKALPGRWAQLREVDLQCLLDFYAVRRDGLGEDHETAVVHVLADVDFEPNQGDLE